MIARTGAIQLVAIPVIPTAALIANLTAFSTARPTTTLTVRLRRGTDDRIAGSVYWKAGNDAAHSHSLVDVLHDVCYHTASCLLSST